MSGQSLAKVRDGLLCFLSERVGFLVFPLVVETRNLWHRHFFCPVNIARTLDPEHADSQQRDEYKSEWN